MTAPIVIHAGFHKTGTSTVQRFLHNNRATLKPYAAIALKPRLTDILHASRGYSTWRDPFSLSKFAARMDAFVQGLNGVKRRGLILSAEELAGHMPGREGIDDYSAALPLLAEIKAAFERHLTAPQLHFVLTLRSAESWLDSSYWEHVKSSSLTEAYSDYASRLRQGADLHAMADRIEASIAPSPVHRVELTTAHPLGLAGPIIDLFDLSEDARASLILVPPKNTRADPEVLQQLLQINRTVPDRDARKQAKQALLRGRETR